MTQRAVLAGMPDWSQGRGQTKNNHWSSRLGGGSITRSQKKKHIAETETRITAGSYWEAGVQDANTWLGQCAKQQMTHKPPMQLLLPKACVK